MYVASYSSIARVDVEVAGFACRSYAWVQLNQRHSGHDQDMTHVMSCHDDSLSTIWSCARVGSVLWTVHLCVHLHLQWWDAQAIWDVQGESGSPEEPGGHSEGNAGGTIRPQPDRRYSCQVPGLDTYPTVRATSTSFFFTISFIQKKFFVFCTLAILCINYHIILLLCSRYFSKQIPVCSFPYLIYIFPVHIFIVTGIFGKCRGSNTRRFSNKVFVCLRFALFTKSLHIDIICIFLLYL